VRTGCDASGKFAPSSGLRCSAGQRSEHLRARCSRGEEAHVKGQCPSPKMLPIKGKRPALCRDAQLLLVS
jgi:hypothetical protein